MANNSSLIVRLEQIRSKIVEETVQRILYWREYNKELSAAKRHNREPKLNGMICPTPYEVPETGELEWRYHILTYERDLKTQVKYLRDLVEEIDYKLKTLKLGSDHGNKILYSLETQDRMVSYYQERAEEMSVYFEDGDKPRPEEMVIPH
jgi:hypothetical protein